MQAAQQDGSRERSGIMSLYDVVRQLNEEMASQSSMEIGKVIKHPDGRMVKVIDGAYLRNGRVSNSWTWREVKADGKLGPKEHGYGW